MSSSDRQAGAAMVEFTIILPLLIMLLFGITELGRALYQQNILAKSTAAATRYLARGYEIITVHAADGSLACTLAVDDYNAKLDQAENIFVYGTYEPLEGAAEILPNLTTDDYTVEVVPRSYSEDVETDACILVAEGRVEFDSVFGDSIVPLLHLGPLFLHAEAEERYIGE